MRSWARSRGVAMAITVGIVGGGCHKTPPKPSPARVVKATEVLAIPYLAQANDTLCQSTVLEMLLRHLTGKSDPAPEIQHQLDAFGGYREHRARARYLQSVLPNFRVMFRYERDPAVAWREIVAMLNLGVPVAMNSKLTPAGHVVLVVGAVERADGTRELIVHDPRGRFDFAAHKMIVGDGAHVRYPIDEFYSRHRMVLVRTAEGVVERQRENYINGEARWLLLEGNVTVVEPPKPADEITEWQYLLLVRN